MSVVDERNWSNTAAAKQGRVVMSGIIDRNLLIRQKLERETGSKLYPEQPMDDQLLGVMPGEILIARNTDVVSDANYGNRKTLGNKRRKLRIRDPDPPVISKVNGVSINAYYRSGMMETEELDETEMAERLYRYVGISNTAYKFDSKYKDLQKTGIAIQIGGTVSMINTGNQVIRQFDKVCWAFPDSGRGIQQKSYAGIDGRSLALLTCPFDPTDAITFDKCERMIQRMEERDSSIIIGNSCKQLCKNMLAAGYSDATKKAFRSMFYTMGLAHAAQRDKIIGVALSSAGQKEQFDIMLGNHH